MLLHRGTIKILCVALQYKNRVRTSIVEVGRLLRPTEDPAKARFIFQDFAFKNEKMFLHGFDFCFVFARDAAPPPTWYAYGGLFPRGKRFVT